MKVLLVLLVKVLLIDKAISTSIDLKNDQNETSFYTAAVMELNAPGDQYSDPHDIVDANLDEYLRWIEEASQQGVDILVFPEAALNYNGIYSRENLSLVAVELQADVPDISECDYSHDTILNELSFAASNASIYILVNAVEMEMCSENESCSDGFKLYNTNLVFDRNGCIVSRYRKFNLFHEPLMNVTEQPELSTFEADFGVNFGHFICFDILFKSPAIELIRTNISHILYPSNWFSETPFLTSIQIQQSFAQGNNIALLSSGTNSPSKSSTGSGIFIGRYGAVEKIISYKNETRMLIAEVPKNIDDSEYMPPSPSALSYPKDEMEALHLRSFSPTNTSSLHESSKIQLEDASCEFSLNFTRLEIPEGSVGYGYRLVAFSGTRSYFGIINAGEIHCAIVSCLDENDEKSCGKRFKNSENLIASVIFHAINIKLSINAEAEDYLVMPTSLNTSIVPLTADQYHFESHITAKDQNYKIESTVEIESLMSFGIYGRNFNRDGKNCEKNKEMEPVDESDFDDDEEEDIDGYFTKSDADDNDLRLKMTIYIVLMVVLSIVTSIMVYRKLQHPYVKPNSNKRKSVV